MFIYLQDINNITNGRWDLVVMCVDCIIDTTFGAHIASN